MNKKTRNQIIIGIVAFLAVINFVLVPHIQRKKAVQTVKTVLDKWSTGDYAAAMDYFSTPAQYKPLYDLTDYKIEGKSFGKKGNSKYAVLHFRLTFIDGSILPSDELWRFEATFNKVGWKIVDYSMEKE